MLTPSSVNSLSAKAECPLQAVKLLVQRESYRTCHIRLPEDTHRLPAITLDGKFYGFFRALSDPVKTLGLLLKLSVRGNQAMMTMTNRGYAVWVYEPDGSLVPSSKKGIQALPPTFGPADCWIISDHQPGYRTCSLKVPDLPDTIMGLSNNRKLYSLYRREKDAADTLKLAARLCQRGDEVVLMAGTAGYVICIEEPGATIAP